MMVAVSDIASGVGFTNFRATSFLLDRMYKLPHKHVQDSLH